MKDIFNFESVESYFEAIFHELCKKQSRKKVELSREWANQFDKQSGVYLIFNGEDLVYVGETGSIKGRMNDLRNTLNHTIRRSIGDRMFSRENGFQKASSKQGYIPAIEKKLNDYMEANLSVSYIVLKIGRKEFEEWLVENNNNNENLYNKRSRRN